MAIRWDKLTVKTQEAFQRANDWPPSTAIPR